MTKKSKKNSKVVTLIQAASSHKMSSDPFTLNLLKSMPREKKKTLRRNLRRQKKGSAVRP